MRDNYALASSMGLPEVRSPYWSQLLSTGRQGYGGKGDFLDREELWPNFRNNVISKGLDNANVPEEAVARIEAKWRGIHERLSGAIPDRFRPFLEESPVGNPTTIQIGNVRVSQSSLEYTYMVTHLEPYLSGVEVVVDLGGGFGGFASLLKRAYPRTRILLLDLPEVNAIQTYFLESALPGKKHLYLRDVHRMEVIDLRALDCDFLVLPGPLVARLAPGSFDLVINSRSMMEMDAATVAFYLEHIQGKLRPGGFFYCLNRYQKKTCLKEYPFDDRWYVSYSEPWPRFIDENPHHELVAGRTTHRVLGGLKEHLAALPPFESPLKEVWRKIRDGT